MLSSKKELDFKYTLLLIAIAYIFAIAVRFVWVEQFSGVEQFRFNHEFMINTNDGYYYAEGARDILSGVYDKDPQKAKFDLSPIDSALSVVTAFFVKVLPFSFERVIFYLSGFLSSLVVIPIILIGRFLKITEVGFAAALISSVAWSYYNRTMFGYYDTDMLNIVFPVFLLWGLMGYVVTKRSFYLLATSFDIILYRWWYPQSYALEFAFIAMLALYFLYLYFYKKERSDGLDIITLVIFMLVAMVNIPIAIRVVGTAGLYIIYLKREELFLKYIWYFLVISVGIFIVTGGFSPIWNKLKSYIFSSSVVATKDELHLHFFTVKQTIREASAIPFEIFANRISGNPFLFILSIVGYIILTFRYRVFLLALPLIGLGFLANGFFGLVHSGGLRFTIYAIVPLAFGLAFLIYLFSQTIAEFVSDQKIKKPLFYILMIFLSIPSLWFNIKHAYDYKVPTVFMKKEVEVLDRLKHIASRDDYVVAWWDYGYPIRYYSDVLTLADGGKHSGSVNFPISYALTQTQDKAANILRYDVELTEKKRSLSDSDADKNRSNIEIMTLKSGYKDTNEFLANLENITPPKKSRDIYLYLPNRMLNIFPTVSLFSNLDLMTGKRGANPIFAKTAAVKDSKRFLYLANGMKLDKSGKLVIGDRTIPLNRFIVTRYQKDGKLSVASQTIDPTSPLNLIYMQNYNQFLILDNKMLNSTYIQLFVLENFNKELYEPVVMTPLVKIYKLKK